MARGWKPIIDKMIAWEKAFDDKETKGTAPHSSFGSSSQTSFGASSQTSFGSRSQTSLGSSSQTSFKSDKSDLIKTQSQENESKDTSSTTHYYFKDRNKVNHSSISYDPPKNTPGYKWILTCKRDDNIPKKNKILKVEVFEHIEIPDWVSPEFYKKMFVDCD